MGEKDTQSIEEVVSGLSNSSIKFAKTGISLVKDIGIEVAAIESGNIFGALAEAPELAGDVKDFITRGKKVANAVTDTVSLIENSEAIKEIGRDAQDLEQRVGEIFKGKDILSNLTGAFQKITELSSDVVGVVKEIYNGVQKNHGLSDVIDQAKNVIGSSGIHNSEPPVEKEKTNTPPQHDTPQRGNINLIAKNIGKGMKNSNLKNKEIEKSAKNSAKTKEGHYLVG